MIRLLPKIRRTDIKIPGSMRCLQGAATSP